VKKKILSLFLAVSIIWIGVAATPQEVFAEESFPNGMVTEKDTDEILNAKIEELLALSMIDAKGAAEAVLLYEESEDFESVLRIILSSLYSQNDEDMTAYQIFVSALTPKAVDIANDFWLKRQESIQEAKEERENPVLPYASGEILVVKKEDASQVRLENTLSMMTMEEVQSIEEDVFVVEIPANQTVAAAIEEAMILPDVLFAQPNFIYHTMEEIIPVSIDDTEKDKQWSINYLNIRTAWGLGIPNNSEDAVVAILDTGVDLLHEDLQSNLVKELCFNVEVNRRILDTDPGRGDDNGHGTHVAGIIAATSNNSKGVAGLSYNAKIFVVDVFRGSEAFSSDIITGINYALAHGADIINMSFGSLGMNFSDDFGLTDFLLAYRLNAISEDAIVVAAGGNSEKIPDYNGPIFVFPADLEVCVAVTSVRQDGTYVPNYIYSDAKNIAAPGSSIYSTTRGGGYGYLSGTSMAAPAVSAILAMLKAKAPHLTNDEIKSILYATAMDAGAPGKDIYYGHGIVNPLEAMKEVTKKLSEPKPPVPTPTPTPAPPPARTTPSLQYTTHVQDIGWLAESKDGALSGTTAQSKRLEGITIRLDNVAAGSGGVKYSTHVQDIGWQATVQNGAMSGTSGQSKRLEAISIELTGKIANEYDIYYQVHAQEFGWLGWAKNGQYAGTAGYSYRLEAIRIVLVAKGGAAPGATANPFYQRLPHSVVYRTHVQDVGWQNWCSNGVMGGTTGQSKRLEGIEIVLHLPYGLSGDVQYRTHIQDYGWENSWKTRGDMSGTHGQSKRLEALELSLSGQIAANYDIYYRVHAQEFGWLGWAKNGQRAGTEGFSYRLEGIEIVLVPKGSPAPGSTANPYWKK